MLFRWMGVHAAWPHFLVLCLVFEGMKRGGGWTGRCWQGGAGQAHHWPLTGPSHLINDPWIRYCAGVWGSCDWTSNTYGGTKVCVCKLYLSLCARGYVCVCVFVWWDGVPRQKSNYLYSLQPYLPSLPLSSSLKWVILAMALTGHGLDFDLCSCEAQIKDSIYCCFMAAGMMNGAVSRSNQASVSLPHILIAKVASHRSALLPSPCLLTSSFLCFSAHCLSTSLVHAQ